MKIILLSIPLILLTGCSSLPERKVLIDENVFISGQNPNLSIKVNHDLSFLSKVKTSEYFDFSDGYGGAFNNNASFLFIDKNERVIDKELSINIWTISDGYWYEGFNKKDNVILDTIGFADFKYDTIVEIYNINRESEQAKYYQSKGYTLPACFISKGYQDVYNRKGKVFISYSEAIDCDKKKMLLPENRYDPDFKNIIQEFNKKADISFKVINTI